jgi:hypothetical protein
MSAAPSERQWNSGALWPNTFVESRRGDPRSILGEPGEAHVQDGGNDGAHDRGRDVQPDVGEIARCDHGAERSGPSL